MCPAATSAAAAAVVVVGAQLIATKWHQKALINSLQMGWGDGAASKGWVVGGGEGWARLFMKVITDALEFWNYGYSQKRNIILR